MMHEKPAGISWLKRMRIRLTPNRLLPRLGHIGLATPSERPAMKQTAGRKNVLRYGKVFIETFPEQHGMGAHALTIVPSTYESNIGIAILSRPKEHKPLPFVNYGGLKPHASAV